MKISPLDFDFTKLANYISPENTLESKNRSWVEAESTFHTIGEFHIFSKSCKRNNSEEIEIRREKHNLKDWQIDAILTYCSDLKIPLDKKETAWIKSITFTCFRHNSITNPNGVAVVLNNTLHFLS